ncbi:MAG TPA: hypothetical protein VMB23_11445, partial [Spirochaetia bacterium]|nr:hypothetical protein [Spirochaetia bacterium]
LMGAKAPTDEAGWGDLADRVAGFYREVGRAVGSSVDPSTVVSRVVADFRAVVTLGTLAWTGGHGEVLSAWALLGRMGELVPSASDPWDASRGLIQDWGLDRRLVRTWVQGGLPPHEAAYWATLVRVQGILTGSPNLKTVLRNPEVQALAGVNAHGGTVWIDKHGLETLTWWMTTRKALEVLTAKAVPRDTNALAQAVAPVAAEGERWLQLAKVAGYRYEEFLAAVEAPVKKVPPKKASVPKKEVPKKVAPKKVAPKKASSRKKT